MRPRFNNVLIFISKALIPLSFLFILTITGVGIYSFGNPLSSEDIFMNHRGEPVKLADFKGKVVLMDFIYTSCPVTGCNLLSLQLLRTQLLLRDRIGKDLFLLSITIDPETDTPEVLKKYAEKYHPDDKGWHFLTGSPDTIHRIMKKYNVEWVPGKDGTRSHKTVIALINQQGETVTVYTDVDYDTEKIVADINNILGKN